MKLALAVTEGLHHQPEERDQPDDAQHDQEDIRNNIARHALACIPPPLILFDIT